MVNPHIDKDHLQHLINSAVLAQGILDQSFKAIEDCMGREIDGLQDIIDTCDAESLIELAEAQDA